MTCGRIVKFKKIFMIYFKIKFKKIAEHVKYDLILVNAYLYVCRSRKLFRNRPPLWLKYSGFSY